MLAFLLGGMMIGAAVGVLIGTRKAVWSCAFVGFAAALCYRHFILG